jgi:putative PEP-CTERM system TPR-repeat lipoprotein
MLIGKKQVFVALLFSALVVGCGKRAPDPSVSLAEAETAMAAKDYRKALVQLKNVVQAQPENGKARFLLGEASHAIRDLVSARKEYERAYDLGFKRDEASLRLAELMQEAGDNKLFIDKFSEYISPDPKVQSEIIAQVGRARFTMGDIAAAKQDFRKALGVNPSEKLALLGLIRAQAFEGDAKGALKAVDGLIEKNPDYALGWIARSELLRDFNDVTAAIAAMERAAQIKPDDLTIQANLASMYLNVGRADAADKALDELRKRAPTNMPAVHYLTALRHYQRGNLQSAKDSIGIALKMQPDAIPYVLLAATIESSSGNVEQAEKHANFVMARTANKNYARSLLAAAYLRAQKGTQAMELLEPAIKEGAKDPNIYALAGEASIMLQNIKAAEGYFAQAAKLAPNDPTQRARLALAKLGQGETDRAISELETAVRTDAPSQYSDVLLIMTYMRTKQYDKALASISALEQKQPKNVLIHNLRATALLGKRDAPGARAALEKGLAANPDSISIIQNLARIDILEGKRTEAGARLEAFVNKNPLNSQGLLALAQYKEQSNAATNEVLALYEKAQAAENRSVTPAVSLASYLVRIGDQQKALSVLRDATQKHPEDAPLLQRYGAMQVQQRDGAGAVSTFSKLTKLQPHVSANWIQLAEGYMLANNEAGAIQSLNRALEAKPAPPQARGMLAQIAFKQGNVEEAKRLAAEITKEFPNLPMGAALSAELAIQAKDWDGAANNYRKALAIAPKDGSIAGRLHNAMMQANQGAAAQRFSEQFRKDSPANITFLAYLADVELRAGKCEAAIPFYRTIVEKDANNVMILNNLAWCAHETKQPDAQGIAERALRIAPRAPAVLDTVGVILSAKGEHERALKMLLDASLAVPNNAEIKLHLAQAYARAGQKDKARSEADAALAMPSNDKMKTQIRQFMSSM